MKYSPLEDKGDQGSQLSEDDGPQDSLLSSPHTPRKEYMHRKLVLLSSVLIPTASLLFLGLGIWIGRKSIKANDICPVHVQSYSPILNEVDTSMHTVRFNGSFKKENPFRLDAGPEVDAAWKSIGSDYKVIIVPPSEAKKAGLTKPSQVRVAKKYGGGYPANVEVLHQLHCLNLLRKASWFNYEYYAAKKEGPFMNEENILKYHFTHCLDTLRQQLMCQPDTAFLGQVWWDKKAPKAFIDFDNEHKCKNFEAIRQWAEDHQLPYLLEDNVPGDFLEAPDIDLVYFEIP
ncbi:hypothetical protein OIDMADRAFT_128513 [Oidiodendron maius Zn]|uniref:Tat pathway signal sequence n=1 Tax=Oidiodendron maius (strain Zn) TaxID=913774 RepID=A0A0C3H8R1_OIDMZ|nr:hypothetical protein OIDMADRAFT_128513 [Oidiodendron maius Zn]